VARTKAFEFATLRPLVAEKVRATVLMGEMAERICRDWSDAVPCQIAVSIADAVERAHALAQPARWCCSPPAPRRSTCSKATPIAATNFARSSAPYRNHSHEDTEVTHPPTGEEKAPRQHRAPLDGRARRDGLRGDVGAEHEALARVAHRARAARRRGRGIIAFNTIKSRQGALPQQRQEAKAAPTAAPAEVAPAAVAKADPATAPITAQTATAMISKPAAAKEDPKQLEKIPKALPVSNTDTGSGNFYVVAKGDNPVSIAKKLKVSQSELLAANNIDDPRKLQIGQKLIVPTPKKAKSKSDAN
jgi:hypothetical protein